MYSNKNHLGEAHPQQKHNLRDISIINLNPWQGLDTKKRNYIILDLSGKASLV